MDMEKPPLSSRLRGDPQAEFNLKEWAFKARIRLENTNSRRFSASNIIRREDTNSFRSNTTISSTASSPGYTLREEIDPSTYSFTTALKALQAKSSASHSWECLSLVSPDGFALKSKWNEAEKYICNPFSGQVPMECLSSKALSGGSFRRNITMSAPLVYSSQPRLPVHPNPSNIAISIHEDDQVHFPIQEKKAWTMSTRDVGTQSTPPDLSSSSPTPAPTPAAIFEERSIKPRQAEFGDSSPTSNITKLKSDEELKKPAEEKKKRKERRKLIRSERKQSAGKLSACRGGVCGREKDTERETHIRRKKNMIHLSSPY